jgi:NADH-quinone oxidoreductase subunit C
MNLDLDVTNPISTNGGDWVAKFGELWKRQITELSEKFTNKVIEEVSFPGEFPTDVPILYVKKESIVEVLRYMKDEPKFKYEFLSDITATDEQGIEEDQGYRFEVVYNLFSHTHLCRIRLKVRVAEGEEVPTAVSVWTGANWAEREIYDMFGVKFNGHPNMRRILMDNRWVGHPLRKDYPIRGYQVFTDAEQVDPRLLDLE